MHIRSRRARQVLSWGLAVGLASACGADSRPSGGAGAKGGGNAGSPSDVRVSGSGTLDPGTPLPLALSAEDQARAAALSEAAGASRKLTADQLRASRARKHVDALGYDPTATQGLNALQSSALRLNDAELQALKERGFLVSTQRSFSTMLEGYAALYILDVPLYVSADSILDSVYRSYDSILRESEETSLFTSLGVLLDGMRKSLAAQKARTESVRDVDFYLAVAKSLFDGKAAAPVAGATAKDIDSFAQSANAEKGHYKRVIFGVERDIDFSQFKPRGHYVKSPALERYFRAMMWLGRIDLRLIDTKRSGEQMFHRRAFEAVVLLRDLVRANEDEWKRIDSTLQAFVGESDYMRISEVDALLSDLGVTSSTLAKADDAKIAQTILDKGYGAQQIASQLIVNDTPDLHTLPLDRSFALFGQRYTVDSHVFSNVVFDRVKGRLMPNPLDVAYAAFGNDAAVSLMAPDLDLYAGALEATRSLVDAHEPSFWDRNLYNLWSKALRALSPAADGGKPETRGMPSVTGTDAWDRRILNTQLASWAQLRHNTVLYAKQSYTSGLACAYPDAYVEPYPEFFAALHQFAKYGSDLAEVLAGGKSSDGSARIRAYFENLGDAAQKLGAMAEAQRAGTPHGDEQLAFINQAVRSKGARDVCAGPPTYDGWYAKLDYELLPDGRAVAEVNPVIADVHTQPTDEGGNDVGRILHVGTGLPRSMVVTVNTCQGPRAYAGLASSYYERVTEGWQRLTDEDWSKLVRGMSGEKPADVPWTGGFTATTSAAP